MGTEKNEKKLLVPGNSPIDTPPYVMLTTDAAHAKTYRDTRKNQCSRLCEQTPETGKALFLRISCDGLEIQVYHTVPRVSTDPGNRKSSRPFPDEPFSYPGDHKEPIEVARLQWAGDHQMESTIFCSTRRK